MSNGAEEDVHHRPLPSVGIPLLRDELRASRLRRAAVAALAVLLGIGAIVAAIFVPGLLPEFSLFDSTDSDASDVPDVALAAHEVPPSTESEEELAPPDPEPVAEPVVEHALENDGTRIERRFGEARGFRPALVSAGCTGAEADSLITALTDVLDFRRCRPEHRLTIDRDAEGRLTRFEYRASSTQIYEATRDDEGTLEGRQVEVPVERIRIRTGGTITASLGGALDGAGLGRTLVGTFVETFEHEVNFNTDTRTGDTFRIIVDEERVEGELLRYGRVHALEVHGQRLGDHQAFFYEPRPGAGDFYDESGRAVHGGWLRTPLQYDHISSPYDPRRMHPILRRIQPHNGVDYAAGTGTPVWAAADGTISHLGPRGANGNLVSIRHANRYESHYAHLSRFASGLSSGDTVRQRQVIGYVGTTGRSTGPHLHFGLKRAGRFVDPQAELNGPGRMMPSGALGRYRAHVRRIRAELAAISVTPETDAPPEPAPTPAEDPTD